MELVPKKYRKLWKEWDLQICVLLSLTLQIILVSLGSRRKYIPRPLIRIGVWSAYLMADSVAILALGTLSNDLAEFFDDKDSIDEKMELTAFWAPFLLLHLGGPDTITAYSLEDNNLWLRHLLGLAVQTGGTVYTFLMSWTGSRLSILSILMILAGFIKYSERVWVLRQASYEQLRNSPSEPTANYSKLMEEKHLKMSEGYAVMNDEVNEVEGAVDLSHLSGNDDLIPKAHGLLQRFKGLFVDLLLKVSDRDTSRLIFKGMSCEDAFKFVEIELGFMYDLLYTKASILCRPWGCVLRIISLSLTFSGLVVFSLADDNYHKYRKVDLAITFILLSVAVLLELYAILLQLSSDRTIVWLWKHNKLTIISQAITYLQQFKRTRWSELMAQFSLIKFSVNKKYYPILVSRILELIDQKLEKEPFVAYEKISKHLKESILMHLKEKLDDLSKKKEKFDDFSKKTDEESSGDADLKFLCSYRGRNVLDKFKCLKLLGWSTNVEFDQSILIWHIATELSYYDDIKIIRAAAEGRAETEAEAVTEAKAEMSNNISQYMLYFLVMYPFMLPTRIGQIRFEDPSAEATNLIAKRKPILSEYMHYLFHIFRISKHKPADLSEACKLLLKVKVKLPVSNAEADRKNSVLFDACKLALQLGKISNKKKKWEMVSEVWLEMLTYAAIQCSGNNHAQQLRGGGELLTHVWLLMAHLGISEQFQMLEGQVIAKIIAR